MKGTLVNKQKSSITGKIQFIAKYHLILLPIYLYLSGVYKNIYKDSLKNMFN